MEDWNAKKAARASAAAALQAVNPHLVPISAKVDSLQAAAKNIRIELKRAFPAVVFSVKSRRFSGGDAIDVRWTDGPMSAQVDAIIDRYSAGSFDGMTDSYNYARDAWKDAFGDAKYIHSARDYSDAAIASAIRTVMARYGSNYAALGLEQPSVEAYRRGDYYRMPLVGSDSLQDLIYREAYRRTWALTKPYIAAAVAKEVAA